MGARRRDVLGGRHELDGTGRRAAPREVRRVVVAGRVGHHRAMASRGELEAVAGSLEELLGRVTAIVERDSATTKEATQDLVAVERGLASTLRRLRRLTTKLSD